jgi:hypothetical protein
MQWRSTVTSQVKFLVFVTDVLSSDGDLKCLVYFRFLDSLNGKPSSSQGPHKIVPRETDTIAFPLKK